MLAVIKDFHALLPADLENIGARCHWRHYGAGEIVLRYEDGGDSIFFIVQGTIRLTYYSMSGHEVLLDDLVAGEMFGELAAIDGQHRSATGVAKTAALLATMPAAAFLELIHGNEHIAQAILRRLASQVRRLTQRVYDYSTLAVRHRVHAALLRLAKEDISAPNQAVIAPAPTHSDLANLISTHREAVTRELNELVRKKLIKREDHTLLILDLKKLRKMVQEVRD